MYDVVASHVRAALKDLYTEMPGIVEAVKVVDGITVIDVQPALNKTEKDGVSYKESLLRDVIIRWPSAGGCYITMPITKGDTVTLHFCMRDVSGWTDSDGSTPITPESKRLHNANDVFATPDISTNRGSREIDSEGVCIGSEAVEIRILKDGTIELGNGAVERLLKGDSFLTQFLSHTHTYVSPSGAALTSPVSTVLSTPDTSVLWEDNLSDVSKTL